MTFICEKCGKEAKMPKRFKYKNLTSKEFLEKEETRRLQMREILEKGCECGGEYKLVLKNTRETELVLKLIKDII